MSWFGKSKKSSEPPSVSDEQAEKFLSDFKAAEKIINDYAAVIETTSKLELSFGTPASLLPHPKEIIKKAIVVYLISRHTLGSLDKKTFDLLKLSYGELASFLEGEDARNAAIGIAEARSGDINEILNSENFSAALSKFTESANESKVLYEEFDALALKFGIHW